MAVPVPESDRESGGDLVAHALRAMAGDAAARDRLAVASVMLSHGESVWAFELAYQVWLNGGTAYQEHSVGGLSRVDLVVAGEAFELNSTFWDYARRNTPAATRDWLAKDVEKLRQASVRGYQLLTMATLVDAAHLRFAPLIRAGRVVGDREAERQQALVAYRDYAASVAAGPIRYVDLGAGSVPGNRGTVQLDALLICVHDPVPSVRVEVDRPVRPAGTPERIKPLGGPHQGLQEVVGTALVASRTHVNGAKDPALRLFVGNVGGRNVGDTFDTVHEVNGMPCGLWTVQAVIVDGHVAAGAVNEGVARYRVNRIE